MPPTALNPWARVRPDPVRESFEAAHFAAVLDRLLALAPGARLLDLGCGDGLVARLAGPRLELYLGADLFPPAGVPAVRVDLRDGMAALLNENVDAAWPLSERLPPLPAHPAARAHHALAAARRALLARLRDLNGPALARAVWGLEPRRGRGLGHGLLAVGRVR